MGELSSEERSSVVLKRDGDCGIGQSLSERVPIVRACAPKVLESGRTALHKWLSHALKGGAGPAHRWCAKEDAHPICRWSSGTDRELSRQIRSVWRSTAPMNGNEMGP